MFFELVLRNSRRSRKENSLFFVSLLASIVAFYIILSLPQQDIMIFLKQMESDAVNKLLKIIPLFYGASLFLLLFLIYFASKYQMERRNHEFGIYRMMGMRQGRLFAMILAEDLWSSIISLLVGIPMAVLLSELISLITARLVGIGILGHQFAFSFHAVLGTIIGFLVIKLMAVMMLSWKMFQAEIEELLSFAPKKKQRKGFNGFYALVFIVGVVFLGCAYGLAIKGIAWTSGQIMGITILLGLAGTFLVFYGLRIVIEFVADYFGKNSRLHIFTCRQLQENVINQPHSLAVSSLLILAALCCFGFGVAVASDYGSGEEHILDYTFEDTSEAGNVKVAIKKAGLEKQFDQIFAVKVGYIQGNDDEKTFQMKQVLTLLKQAPDTEENKMLLDFMKQVNDPNIISLSGYNQLLKVAGEKQITLRTGQVAAYSNPEFMYKARAKMLNQVLKQNPRVQIKGKTYQLKGNIQAKSLVTDRAITVAFGLIVPDKVYDQLTKENGDTYWNAVLSAKLLKNQSLTQTIMQVNKKLERAGIPYESYLQNIGRKLFYVAASSYLTIYLAVIFLIIANTVIGVQFLMQQQKAERRYRSLIWIGSDYRSLYDSVKKQIRWYFGLPIVVAVIGSLFGTPALFRGMLSSDIREHGQLLLLSAFAMILFLCVIELCYMHMVIKISGKYMLSLMSPKRKE